MAEPENVYEQNWSSFDTPIPVKSIFDELIEADEGSEWLPKTDWSRDGIIANDD